MLIKCTKKLLAELKLPPEPIDDSPPFFCWHANCAIVNRRKSILLINDAAKTLVLLYGLKGPDYKRIASIISESISQTFASHGFSQETVAKYMQKAGELSFTATTSKSLLSNLTQSILYLPAYIDDFTTESFNQLKYNTIMYNYPFTIGRQQVFPSNLLPDLMKLIDE